MTDKNFDAEIIDPEEMGDALLAAQGKAVAEDVTILTLMASNDAGNPIRVKVRYKPASSAHSFEADDGMSMRSDNNPKFKYKKTIGELISKMNRLCLKNIQIVDDLSFPSHEFQRGEIRLTLIAPGEFSRLRELCFPGANFDTPDSEVQENVSGRKGGKGLRSRQPAPTGE